MHSRTGLVKSRGSIGPRRLLKAVAGLRRTSPDITDSTWLLMPDSPRQVRPPSKDPYGRPAGILLVLIKP